MVSRVGRGFSRLFFGELRRCFVALYDTHLAALRYNRLAALSDGFQRVLAFACSSAVIVANTAR